MATFNWDPFLFLAHMRNRDVGALPQILFLHGCAVLGYCEEHKKQGPLDARCGACGGRFLPARLLYPVRDKDYAADRYIESQWRGLRSALERAFVLTVFGYSAPESDAEAVKLMGSAWGRAERRELEETEIINTTREDELAARWNRFICGHHYRTTADYFESILSRFPRRSCEAIWEETQECRFLEYASVPRFPSLETMQLWFKELCHFERER